MPPKPNTWKPKYTISPAIARTNILSAINNEEWSAMKPINLKLLLAEGKGLTVELKERG